MEAQSKQRIAVAFLSLSMMGFIGITQRESFTSVAVIPVKGDPPTIGHGSTSYEDGSPVKMGDRITPTRALVVAANHVSKDERVFRASLPGVSLHQEEFDLYLDWTYQFGTGAWGKSSMRRELLAGNYAQACNALLKYKFSGGYDCSTPGNKVCRGVWTRQLERHEKCMGAQS